MKNREVLRLRSLTTAQGEEVGLFLPLEALIETGIPCSGPTVAPAAKAASAA